MATRFHGLALLPLPHLGQRPSKTSAFNSAPQDEQILARMARHQE
jgi:hypothetical protein